MNLTSLVSKNYQRYMVTTAFCSNRSQFVQSVLAQCLVELSSARSTFRFTIQGQDGKAYILVRKFFIYFFYGLVIQDLRNVLVFIILFFCLSRSRY